MKFKAVLLSLGLSVALLAGCSTEEAPKEDTAQETQADAVAAASSVSDLEGFEKAISADGTWIIIALEDINAEDELVAEGEFRNKGNETKDIYRKLALYAQDADRNVTARYTLTTPKLTVKSENFKIQGGTVKGDVIVESNGFVLTDATVEGNLYFASEEYKASAKIDDNATVTGATEVK